VEEVPRRQGVLASTTYVHICELLGFVSQFEYGVADIHY
jgi:hypothetical protein